MFESTDNPMESGNMWCRRISSELFSSLIKFSLIHRLTSSDAICICLDLNVLVQCFTNNKFVCKTKSSWSLSIIESRS